MQKRIRNIIGVLLSVMLTGVIFYGCAKSSDSSHDMAFPEVEKTPKQKDADVHDTKPQTPDAASQKQAKLPDNAVLLKVAWPLVTAVDMQALAQLSKENQDRVANSPIPVLVPKDDGMLKNGTVMIDAYGYDFSTENNGLHLLVSAGNLTYNYPDFPKINDTNSFRGNTGLVSRDEIGWSASWNENGVVYAFRLACPNNHEAPPCDNEKLLLKFVNEAVYVGGNNQP